MNTKNALELLNSFQGRKGMYVHPVAVDSVLNFLAGFRWGWTAGATGYSGVWWDAQEKRGWQKVAVGPIPQMRNKGMTDEEIMDELIEIEKEVMRLLS